MRNNVDNNLSEINSAFNLYLKNSLKEQLKKNEHKFKIGLL